MHSIVSLKNRTCKIQWYRIHTIWTVTVFLTQKNIQTSMLYRTIKSDTYLPGWLAEKTWCEYIWAINAEQICERTFIDATLANDLDWFGTECARLRVQNLWGSETTIAPLCTSNKLPNFNLNTRFCPKGSNPSCFPVEMSHWNRVLSENSNTINCHYESSISLGRALGVHAKVIELLHFAPQLMTWACTTEYLPLGLKSHRLHWDP